MDTGSALVFGVTSIATAATLLSGILLQSLALRKYQAISADLDADLLELRSGNASYQQILATGIPSARPSYPYCELAFLIAGTRRAWAEQTTVGLISRVGLFAALFSAANLLDHGWRAWSLSEKDFALFVSVSLYVVYFYLTVSVREFRALVNESTLNFRLLSKTRAGAAGLKTLVSKILQNQSTPALERNSQRKTTTQHK